MNWALGWLAGQDEDEGLGDYVAEKAKDTESEYAELLDGLGMGNSGTKARAEAEVSDIDRFNRLTFSGLDYTGQAQVAHGTKGKGLVAETSLSLIDLYLPFVTAELQVHGKVSGTGSHYQLLLLERQYERHECPNASPIALSDMHGSCYESYVTIGVKVAMEVPALAPRALKAMNVEMLMFSLDCEAEASIGSTVKASFWDADAEDTHYYEHPTAALMDTTKALQSLETPFDAGSIGSKLRHATQFRMSAHSVAHEAGIEAKLSAVLGHHGEQGHLAANIATEVGLEFKTTAYNWRLQSQADNGIFATQDTRLLLKHVTFKGPTLTRDLSVKLGDGEDGGEVHKEGLHEKEYELAGDDEFVTMSYKTAMVYWWVPGRNATRRQKRENHRFCGQFQKDTQMGVTMLPRTGIVTGHSVTRLGLGLFYLAERWKKGDASRDPSPNPSHPNVKMGSPDGYDEGFPAALAVALGMASSAAEKVREGLLGMAPEYYSLHDDAFVQPRVFVLEAAFAIPTHHGKQYPPLPEGTQDDSSIPQCVLPELKKRISDSQGYLLPQFLSSLRLRYRNADTDDDEHTRFKLGFSFLGQGAEVSWNNYELSGVAGSVTVGYYGYDATNNMAHPDAIPLPTLVV